IALSTTLDSDAIFDRMLEQIARVIPYDAANIALVSGGRSRVVRTRSSRELGEEAARALPGLTFDIAATPNLRRMVQTRQPLVVPDTAADPDWISTPALGRTRSWAGAPIVDGDRVIAFIGLAKTEPNFYRPADAHRLAAFAAHAAVALRNAHLFDETRRRARQLATLNELAREMTGQLNAETLCRLVAQRLHDSFHYSNVAVLLLAPDGKELVLQSVSGIYAPRLTPGEYRQPVGKGIIGEAARTGQTTLHDDAHPHPKFYTTPSLDVRSEIAIPLKSGDDILGVLVISSRQVNAFREEDIAMLTTAADQLAVALQNAFLFSEVQQRVAELEAVRQASLTVTASLELESVLDALLQATLSLLKEAQTAHIFLFEGERITYGTALWNDGRKTPILAVPRPNGLTRTVARTGEPLFVADMRTHPLYAGSPNHPLWRGAIAGLPLKIGERVVGVMNISYPAPRHWSPAEVRVLQLMADQAAIAIENARLYQTVQSQARQLENVLNAAPNGILLLDADHRILLANSAAQSFLPLLSAGRPGEPLTRLGNYPLPDVLETTRHGGWLEISPDEAAFVPRTFEIAARPIAGDAEAKEVEGWVLVIQDVTDKRAVQKQIRQQERLAAVGQLAAGIAHDFNNILTSIIGYASLLQVRPDMPSESQPKLQNIIQQGQRAAALVRQILDFARQSVPRKQTLNMAAFLRESLALLERTIPESIHITLEVEAGAENSLLTADPAQLQQVLTNLAVNARDAMPGGGTLHFRLAPLTLRPADVPPLPEMPPGHWLALAITDSGEGISPEVLPRIFEPFFTTKDVGQGTGLGLSQVYGIVKQHDGYITVASQPGEGTTFTLYLPAAPEPAPRPARSPDSPAPHPGQGETLLLVEDEAGVREAARAMLEHLGYRVLTAADGQEALKVYHTHRREIAAVLTDMTMPQMGGLELSRHLRAQSRNLPVLLLTGYPLQATEAELKEKHGVWGWLQKPLNFDQLARTLTKML
ncbi:MAG: GAF domain-containing protein, partial [Caldilineae bacterium]